MYAVFWVSYATSIPQLLIATDGAATRAEILAARGSSLYRRTHLARSASESQDDDQQGRSASFQRDGGTDQKGTRDCQGGAVYLYQLP